MDKKDIFDTYYYNKVIGEIKWFESFVQPEMIEEYNKKNIRVGMKLLDVGCGCSMDSIFFATKGLDVSALDFSPNALKKLNALASIIGVDVKTINASVLSIPIQYSKSFDVILDNGCFHHICPEDRGAYVRSVVKALKSGGCLYIRSFSDFEQSSSDTELGAYRISSDVIINTFFQNFKIEEIRLFDYILTSRGRQKMWFVKLRMRDV